MPKIVFKSSKLDVKRALLDRMIDSYLQDNCAITRTSVAKSCGASKTSAGKIASALTNGGFMYERLYSDPGKHPALHLFSTQNFNVLIIDLSSAKYTLSIMSNDYKCLFEKSHEYDADISFEDNLGIFLSRCGLDARKSGKTYAATCVIYYDIPRNNNTSEFNRKAHLPSLSDKGITDKIIYSVFRRYPDLYISTTQAIGATVKYNIFPRHAQGNGVSYVFAGTYLCAFHATSHAITHCNISSLMVDGRCAKDMIGTHLDHTELSLLLTRAVNLMYCAYNTDCVILESDVYDLDRGYTADISKAFARSGEFVSDLIVVSRATGAKYAGAVKATFVHTVKRCLIATDDKNT